MFVSMEDALMATTATAERDLEATDVSSMQMASAVRALAKMEENVHLWME